jgi:hypothetical protein
MPGFLQERARRSEIILCHAAAAITGRAAAWPDQSRGYKGSRWAKMALSNDMGPPVDQEIDLYRQKLRVSDFGKGSAAPGETRVLWRRLILSVQYIPKLAYERQHRILLPILEQILGELEAGGLEGAASSLAPAGPPTGQEAGPWRSR